MDLTPFVDQLRRDLAAAADTGTEVVRTAAGQLAAALDPSARIVLLDALVSAADELTSSSDVVVDVRLRGREVELALQHAAPLPPEPPHPARSTASPRATSKKAPRGSASDCRRRSRSEPRKPPLATACRSTPGWSGRRCWPSMAGFAVSRRAWSAAAATDSAAGPTPSRHTVHHRISMSPAPPLSYKHARRPHEGAPDDQLRDPRPDHTRHRDRRRPRRGRSPTPRRRRRSSSAQHGPGDAEALELIDQAGSSTTARP